MNMAKQRQLKAGDRVRLVGEGTMFSGRKGPATILWVDDPRDPDPLVRIKLDCNTWSTTLCAGRELWRLKDSGGSP